MPCISQQCNQGRKLCPSPLICDAGLHRIDGPWHDYAEPEPFTQDDTWGWIDNLIDGAWTFGKWLLVALAAIAAVCGLVVWLFSTWPVAFAVAVLSN